MKLNNIRIILLILMWLIAGFSTSIPIAGGMDNPTVEIKVATYNVRLPAEVDVSTGNSWAVRKEHVAGLMLRHGFDIVGIQEPYQNTIYDLDSLLVGFDKVTAPYATKSFLAIYYKKALFEVLDSGHFWLSETPDEPSIGWDSDEKRICQWVKFKDKKSSKEFYYFNSHFYWRLKTARKNSGPLVARRIEKIAGGAPVIFVGDLNSRPIESQIEGLKILLNDAFDVTQTPRKGPENTNLGGGNFEGEPYNRIDYIFVSKDIKVLDFTVHDDKYGGERYPSDHLPISANIKIE